ncbi:hypothetical protein RYZ27_02460 [Hyphomonas sp. FCG-A18]|uniref:hypothetical protein n=1 Tax=Hyphomonas sp. FCG-A18 TaxID=3080019 RepID=UPI002B2BCE95|nr:hypothetical protein RYZ27_02460 [Hyphomonas sp. FCG-A18]
MKLLRAATVTVADLSRTISNYETYFDYTVVERGEISPELAESWGTPKSAGCPYAVMQPASGADIFLRFVEQAPVEGFKALRSYGWNAIEICVQDVIAVNERMLDSPFEIIGPPNKIPGLDAIHPMQVKGPDEEIVYLTQINDDLPEYNLPRAGSLIDKLFILVMGSSDMEASAKWMQEKCGLAFGREMDIPYTMIAKAYGTPLDELHRICTLIHDKDVFLELDQYPDAATPRPNHEDMLVPGCAIGTLWHPDFDSLPGPWLTAPTVREGAIYKGKRVGVLKDLDGTLIEMVEG